MKLLWKPCRHFLICMPDSYIYETILSQEANNILKFDQLSDLQPTFTFNFDFTLCFTIFKSYIKCVLLKSILVQYFRSTDVNI